MDPQEQFCHNEGCWAYGRKAEGHIVIHSSTERRFTGCTSQRNWCSLW